MKTRALIHLVLLIGTATMATAQESGGAGAAEPSPAGAAERIRVLEAKAAYEIAEERYEARDYAGTLRHLEQAQRTLGHANRFMLHLQILTEVELAKTDPGYLKRGLDTIDRLEQAPDFDRLDDEKVVEVMKLKLGLREELAQAVARAQAEEKRAMEEERRVAAEAEQARQARAREAEQARKLEPFIARTHAIGDLGPAGGVIFYDKGAFTDGWRYLECAPAGWSGSPTDPSAPWGCQNSSIQTSGTLGTGKSNTDKIVQSCAEETAAGLASAHSVTVEGIVYDDWFLPSLDELLQLFKTPGPVRKGLGLSKMDTFWSSSQVLGNTEAGCIITWQLFASMQSIDYKKAKHKLRPIRMVTFKGETDAAN